jgi:hypothetical protein
MTAVVQRMWNWPWAARQQQAQRELAMPEPDMVTDSRAARDRRLATILADTRLAWLLDERFDAAERAWTVDLLRADADAGWRRQRYKYDVERGVLYFWGEQPVDAAEVRAMNLRTLAQFRPQPMPSPVARTASAMTTGAVSPALPRVRGVAHPQFSGAA